MFEINGLKLSMTRLNYNDCDYSVKHIITESRDRNTFVVYVYACQTTNDIPTGGLVLFELLLNEGSELVFTMKQIIKLYFRGINKPALLDDQSIKKITVRLNGRFDQDYGYKITKT